MPDANRAIQPGASAASKRFNLKRLIPLGLVLAGVLAYINTLPNAFVFDDVPWIPGNPRITSLTNLPRVLTATNRPVLELSLALDYALGGKDPAVYHLTNLIIHVLAALVLYGLVRRTLGLPRFSDRFRDAAPWLAGSVAILWLLHPLNTQAVTYTIQRGESLMGLCYLAVLYCFVRYATAGSPQLPAPHKAGDAVAGPSPDTTNPPARPNRALPWAVAAVALCWIGMGTKEVMATAPLIVLLFDATFISKSWREPLTRRPLFYAGLFTAWIPLAWFLMVIAKAGPDASAGLALESKMLSRWTYLLSQPQVITEVYLRKAFWPNPLVLDYGWVPAIPQDTPPDQVVRLFLANVLWQGALLTTLFIASLFGVIKRTAWGFLGLSFFLILAPTSSFMPIADLAVEHRMYLPLIPVVVLVVFAGYALLRRGVPGKAGAYGMTLVLLFALVFGLLTMARNTDYQSRISIWDSVVVARPNNPRGWFNLGSARRDEGRPDEALQCYMKVLQIMPNYAAAHYGIGTIYLDAGDLDKAIGSLNESIRLDPDDAASHAQLGRALLFAGRYNDAELSLRETLRLDPGYARAYEYLGLLFVARKDPDRAVASFRRAIRADPRLLSAYQNLAAALSESGQPGKAVKVIETVLRHADEWNLTPEQVREFKAKRHRYDFLAEQAPDPP